MPPLPVSTGLIVRAFTDMGMAASTGIGFAPLPYTEIAAAVPWTDPAERKLIRQMSESYLAGYRIGDDPFGIPPWKG